MSPQELDRLLSIVQRQLEPAERFLTMFGAALAPPIWYQSEHGHVGFRYTSPDARHFCLLKGSRAVSGINACIQLARGGYTQEIGVIVRTVVECTSLIEWIKLKANANGTLRSDPQRRYVRVYFEDYRRDGSGLALNLRERQKVVHDEVGDWLDKRAHEIGIKIGDKASGDRLSNIYMVNSNYVHARYPEVMDMFGGRPGSYHLRGMGGTPKDDENAEIIQTYAVTVDQSIAGIAQHFQPAFLQTDPAMNLWSRRGVA